MTKNRAQPARYRPGKAEAEDVASEEESSEEEDEDERPAPAKAPPPKATSFPNQKKLAVDLSKAGQQISSAPKLPQKSQDEDLEGFVTASESSEDEDAGDSGSESGSEEEESEEEEESSSDDEPKRPMLAPKFISKAKRVQQTTADGSADAKAAEEEKLRKEKADAILQAQLERDAAARAAGRRGWDDDDIAVEDDLDDADGLDPEAEKAAWKLRELKRVRRYRLAIEEKEKEREEIERRRNLTAEEREEEDKKFIEAQKESREDKGQMSYMQKYHHKGAFYNDAGEEDEEVKAVLNRDFAGARFEDDADKSALPEYMQIRDSTRVGRKGRTKYKDLKNEDTGQWGRDVGRKKGEYDGVDDRFRPDDPRGGGEEWTGANSAPVGERRRREDDGYRDREAKRPRYE
jgi:microfibrillar-associated protein 1